MVRDHQGLEKNAVNLAFNHIKIDLAENEYMCFRDVYGLCGSAEFFSLNFLSWSENILQRSWTLCVCVWSFTALALFVINPRWTIFTHTHTFVVQYLWGPSINRVDSVAPDSRKIIVISVVQKQNSEWLMIINDFLL